MRQEIAMVSGIEVLFNLWASISKMVLDDTRKASEVAKYLQVIISREDFVSILDRPPSVLVDTTPADWWQEWDRFYQEVFGLQVDFSEVKIKEDPGGFGWVVMVAQGLTLNQVWDKCRERFPCYSIYGNDLDNVMPKNDRNTQSAYSRRLRNRVESDEENKSLSANVLANENIQANTLLERFLLGLWYHWRTGGGQLDLLNQTLCAGSRGYDGLVPFVRWTAGQLQVRRSVTDGADRCMRARSTV